MDFGHCHQKSTPAAGAHTRWRSTLMPADRPSTAFVLTRVNWSLGDDHSPRVGEC